MGAIPRAQVLTFTSLQLQRTLTKRMQNQKLPNTHPTLTRTVESTSLPRPIDSLNLSPVLELSASDTSKEFVLLLLKIWFD